MSQRSAMRPGGAPLGDRALAAGGLAFELAKKWWVLLIRGILLIIITTVFLFDRLPELLRHRLLSLDGAGQ